MIDQEVAYEIQDQGPGLSPEVRSALFRPLLSTKKSGGGIGLAISHQLARHAGGTLTLLQSGPSGTRFRLSIPVLSRRLNDAAATTAKLKG
jgi:signal transduction histidine kinase